MIADLPPDLSNHGTASTPCPTAANQGIAAGSATGRSRGIGRGSGESDGNGNRLDHGAFFEGCGGTRRGTPAFIKWHTPGEAERGDEPTDEAAGRG